MTFVMCQHDKPRNLETPDIVVRVFFLTSRDCAKCVTGMCTLVAGYSDHLLNVATVDPAGRDRERRATRKAMSAGTATAQHLRNKCTTTVVHKLGLTTRPGELHAAHRIRCYTDGSFIPEEGRHAVAEGCSQRVLGAGCRGPRRPPNGKEPPDRAIMQGELTATLQACLFIALLLDTSAVPEGQVFEIVHDTMLVANRSEGRTTLQEHM